MTVIRDLDETTDRTYELRTPEPAEFDDLARVTQRAYGGYPDPPEIHEMNRKIFEFDRAITVRHRGQICGTATIYSLEMTLPGGPLAVAGVGYVSVAPDHRRRGLMRKMLHHQLTVLHEQNAEPVAALNSTEGGIYGRFGYGIASQVVRIRIPRGPTVLLPQRPVAPSLQLRTALPADCLSLVSSCYDANVPVRPGMLRRDATWTRRALLDPPDFRGGAAPLQAFVVEDNAEVHGYALYTTKPNWEDSSPRNQVLVRELYARTDPAYAELWAALLDLDLTATVVADTRPVDDPILAMLVDPRTAVPLVRDQLHVRLVDVDRGLAARRYANEFDLVLDVEDSMCAWNQGSWRLRGGRDYAECMRTNASADLAITAHALGSAYLGGISLWQLAAAGHVSEYRPGALALAMQAFRHDPAPFCSTTF